MQYIVAKTILTIMKLKVTERRINELKQQLYKVGIPIPGSIHISYRRCGKKSCRCQLSDDNLHGPYYVWYRRENGRLTTQSIKKEDIHLYKEWIKNREKMEMIINKILEIGSQYPGIRKKLKINYKKSVS